MYHTQFITSLQHIISKTADNLTSYFHAPRVPLSKAAYYHIREDVFGAGCHTEVPGLLQTERSGLGDFSWVEGSGCFSEWVLKCHSYEVYYGSFKLKPIQSWRRALRSGFGKGRAGEAVRPSGKDRLGSKKWRPRTPKHKTKLSAYQGADRLTPQSLFDLLNPGASMPQMQPSGAHLFSLSNLTQNHESQCPQALKPETCPHKPFKKPD